MPKLLIFQRFDLDLEAMTQLSKEELSNLLGAGRNLTRGLLEEGYSILESNETFCGINNSIIVGGEYGQDHKVDFYGLANILGLRYYKSGQYYTQRE